MKIVVRSSTEVVVLRSSNSEKSVVHQDVPQFLAVRLPTTSFPLSGGGESCDGNLGVLVVIVHLLYENQWKKGGGKDVIRNIFEERGKYS